MNGAFTDGKVEIMFKLSYEQAENSGPTDERARPLAFALGLLLCLIKKLSFIASPVESSVAR